MIQKGQNERESERDRERERERKKERKKERKRERDPERVHNLRIFLGQIMAETYKRPNIKEACHVPNRLSDLENLSAGLEKCQKSLNDYLDSKRNAFPR